MTNIANPNGNSDIDALNAYKHPTTPRFLTPEEKTTLTVDKVVEAFSGRHECMCGCQGKYYVNPDRVAEADKNRGYSSDDFKPSATMVKRVLNTLLKADDAVIENGYILYSNGARKRGERNYVVYFTQG